MKESVKSLVRILVLLLVSPLIAAHLIARGLNLQDTFSALSQWISLIPGNVGSYFRIAFYRFALNHCDVDCKIGFLTIFSHADTNIEQGVYIGAQCNIGKCRIGRDTMIASGVHIMSGNRQHRTDDLDTPMQQQGGEFTKTDIGEDCWIGNGALVMANVGRKSIIGAGSVVTQDIPDYSIAVGNPARVIRSRKPDQPGK
jgi:virginiamycin A acetyltransferase